MYWGRRRLLSYLRSGEFDRFGKYLDEELLL